MVNVSRFLFKVHTMKTYGGVEVIMLHAFPTSALDEVSGQFHVLATSLQEKQQPMEDRWTSEPVQTLWRR
jgi:hypothetical protein